MEWISVNDRLPERNEYVLVSTPYCKYICDVALFNGVAWYSCEKSDYMFNIVYWMPLPEPPK